MSIITTVAQLELCSVSNTSRSSSLIVGFWMLTSAAASTVLSVARQPPSQSPWHTRATVTGSSTLNAGGQLTVNGDFNLDVLNGGFDWQYQRQSSVALTLDPSDFHSGHRSLLVNFDGPGISDAGIRQFIAVQPNTPYEFSAYYKNGEIQGAGGPHLCRGGPG